MAIPLDRVHLDGDVLDDCDQLAVGLGRLHRQRRIGEEDWITSKQSLVEASLTIGRRTDRP
ncbi:MAG: hypothetical protein JOZ41_07470 [Chloroflexi bacterium]|nr:hypothetical protein [Chloroflexota bacterium]